MRIPKKTLLKKTYTSIILFGLILLISSPFLNYVSSSPLSRDNDEVPHPKWFANSGIGEFFHKLYEATANNTYLKYYEGSYQWVISKAKQGTIGDPSSYSWRDAEGIDVLNLEDGTSGIARVLLNAYQRNGNITYLQYAIGGARYLMNIVVNETTGVPEILTWDTLGTGYMHGALGIGDFFTDLYLETGNTTYLKYSKGMANWIVDLAEPGNPGYKWPDFKGNDHTILLNITFSNTTYAMGWCFGAASKIYYLLRLYNLTDDITYLEYAKGGLEWLIHSAIIQNDQAYWHIQDNLLLYSSAEGLGAAGIGRVFWKAYQMLGNITYRDYAIMAANWLVNSAIEFPGHGYAWLKRMDLNEIYNWKCWGVSGVSLFLAEMWNWTQNETYKTFAVGGIDYLDYVKIEDPFGYRWRPNNDTSSPSYCYYAWGTSIPDCILKIGQIFLDTSMIEIAEKAANRLIKEAHTENSGYYWYFCFDTEEDNHIPGFNLPISIISICLLGIAVIFINYNLKESKETILGILMKTS
ncbi:MAG: lanthionine synthetase LanC family protein [Candidatus Helarchaeota archaeon]